MAARLGHGITSVTGGKLAYPVQANGVFVVLPAAVVESLQAEWPFYVWDEDTGVVRLMCSFDTAESDVDAFVARLGDLMPGR
jgi:threonine aldolase